MNCGSIAIALRAEYGDDSDGGISLIGSMRRRRCPARSSQRVTASRSPISPMPQLRDEGIENSGISSPARRDNEDGLTGSSRAREPKEPLERPGEDLRRRQQADDHERLVREVEEEPRVHEDLFAL